MRRSVPFLRSDRLFHPVGQQSQSLGLFQWLPLNGSPTIVGKSAIFAETYGDKISPYVFRSDMAPIFNLCTDILDEKLDYDTYRRLLTQWRDLAPAYVGDYYPLTASTLDESNWMAWQFYAPQQGEGFVQAFRRTQAADKTKTFKLHGLDRSAAYDLIDVDQPDKKNAITGAQLIDEGLAVTCDAQPGAVLVRIVRQK
jgi:alpha-galactosidase